MGQPGDLCMVRQGSGWTAGAGYIRPWAPDCGGGERDAARGLRAGAEQGASVLGPAPLKRACTLVGVRFPASTEPPQAAGGHLPRAGPRVW